jgi:hypothetical protein
MKLDIDAPPPCHDFSLPLKETEKYVVLEVVTSPVDKTVELTVIPRKVWEANQSVDPVPEDSATEESDEELKTRLEIYEVANRLATGDIDTFKAIRLMNEVVNAWWWDDEVDNNDAMFKEVEDGDPVTIEA